MMTLLKLFSIFLPWKLKRLFLIKFFSYQIHPSARIKFSWIFPKMLIMQEGSEIDHFNTAIHLDEIKMEKYSVIGRGNWITGFTTYEKSSHFKHQAIRKSSLLLGESSAITKNHHLDCTSPITIGRFTTIAGYNSQLLTHSIDLIENRQDSHPISIGDYAFVGTNVVILGDATLPSYSVLGAKSLLNRSFQQPYTLYGGVPAKPIKNILENAKYFHRTEGFVY
ncbi:acyltransferase [Cyclobacterium jeungdonense]|uniref:Acyltransferase n=1 Tax=Cyclobacterium jeungdonense TaxID=708087 RepID=A0ABT8C922_9BACT|nr:acyltransferase [Cyclobacterium jeungdonense]MDN3688866.1 acyltransferase [Cyclobacterium jeungdonense]